MSFFFSPRHITDYDLYYTMSASSGSGTAYPYEAPEFTPVVATQYLVFCVMLL
jgi:hypothetical protein